MRPEQRVIITKYPGHECHMEITSIVGTNVYGTIVGGTYPAPLNLGEDIWCYASEVKSIDK